MKPHLFGVMLALALVVSVGAGRARSDGGRGLSADEGRLLHD